MSESIVARWSDFLELTKPRVVALMLLTALIGMCMAVPGLVPWEPLVYGNLGIGLCAGAAAAINHVVDERIESVPDDVLLEALRGHSSVIDGGVARLLPFARPARAPDQFVSVVVRRAGRKKGSVILYVGSSDVLARVQIVVVRDHVTEVAGPAHLVVISASNVGVN